MSYCNVCCADECGGFTVAECEHRAVERERNRAREVVAVLLAALKTARDAGRLDDVRGYDDVIDEAEGLLSVPPGVRLEPGLLAAIAEDE